MCAILEEKRVGIAAVTVRIHSLSGIAPAPHIIKHDTGAIYGCRSDNYYLLYHHRNDLDAAFFLCDEFTRLGLIHALLGDTRLLTTPILFLMPFELNSHEFPIHGCSSI